MYQVVIKMCDIAACITMKSWQINVSLCSRMDGWLKAIFLAFFQTNNPNWFPLNDLSWVHTPSAHTKSSAVKSGHSSSPSNLCLQVFLCSTLEAVVCERKTRPLTWVDQVWPQQSQCITALPYLVRIWVALWSDLGARLTTLFTQQNLPVQQFVSNRIKWKHFLYNSFNV